MEDATSVTSSAGQTLAWAWFLLGAEFQTGPVSCFLRAFLYASRYEGVPLLSGMLQVRNPEEVRVHGALFCNRG